MLSLTNKRILVTGASSGIGRDIAITAASIGAAVTITGRDINKLQVTLSAMQGDGHAVIAADITTPAGIQSIIQDTAFDGVVFNAGVVEYVPVKFLSEQKINQIFSVNINAAMLLCQQLLSKKLVNKKGSLVFISSISAKLGVPGTALYAASKAALNAFAKVTASECAVRGIRSNSVCPGIIQTSMTDAAASVTSGEEMTKAAQEYPLGYGEAKDVSGLVMYLLSDLSKWMTGSDIVIDGGYTLK